MNVIQRASLLLITAMAASAQAQVSWQSGLLSVNQKVADNLLQPLSIGYGGYPIWKSNNPGSLCGGERGPR